MPRIKERIMGVENQKRIPEDDVAIVKSLIGQMLLKEKVFQQHILSVCHYLLADQYTDHITEIRNTVKEEIK